MSITSNVQNSRRKWGTISPCLYTILMMRYEYTWFTLCLFLDLLPCTSEALESVYI
jgi:hypothetical protein